MMYVCTDSSDLTKTWISMRSAIIKEEHQTTCDTPVTISSSVIGSVNYFKENVTFSGGFHSYCLSNSFIKCGCIYSPFSNTFSLKDKFSFKRKYFWSPKSVVASPPFWPLWDPCVQQSDVLQQISLFNFYLYRSLGDISWVRDGKCRWHRLCSENRDVFSLYSFMLQWT